ncbi:MAG TPA: hypothetical protein ENH82_04830 [bacterium]|nr:hypothetical protein [bacterium]
MKLSHILEAKYAGNVVYIPTDETTNGDTTWGINSYELKSGQPLEPQIVAKIEKDYGESWDEIMEYMEPPSAVWVVRKDIYEIILRASRNTEAGNDSFAYAIMSMMKSLFHEVAVQTIKLNWPRRNQQI